MALMCGIRNLRYGSIRVCIYHLHAGVWSVQRWCRRQRWQPMPHIGPKLAMRMWFTLPRH